MNARNVFSSIYKSGPVTTTGANAVMFVNEGTRDFLINGSVTVKPGNGFSISQVSAEVTDVTDYDITFQNDSGTLTLDPVFKCVIVRVGVYKTNC